MLFVNVPKPESTTLVLEDASPVRDSLRWIADELDKLSSKDGSLERSFDSSWSDEEHVHHHSKSKSLMQSGRLKVRVTIVKEPIKNEEDASLEDVPIENGPGDADTAAK